MEHEADLVEKTLTRFLNMEFDWKRRPRIVDVDPERAHLRFDTTPWKTIEQFQTARRLWSDFQRGGKECLKTAADYDEFAVYANARAADDGGRVFVEGGDLARLRQGLCRAWKQSVAGLRYREGAATAREFADLLTMCGIPTKRHDVENSRRTLFKTNSVPRSATCISALEKVRGQFPSIRPEEFLAAETETGDLLYILRYAVADAEECFDVTFDRIRYNRLLSFSIQMAFQEGSPPLAKGTVFTDPFAEGTVLKVQNAIELLLRASRLIADDRMKTLTRIISEAVTERRMERTLNSALLYLMEDIEIEVIDEAL